MGINNYSEGCVAASSCPADATVLQVELSLGAFYKADTIPEVVNSSRAVGDILLPFA